MNAADRAVMALWDQVSPELKERLLDESFTERDEAIIQTIVDYISPRYEAACRSYFVTQRASEGVQS